MLESSFRIRAPLSLRKHRIAYRKWDEEAAPGRHTTLRHFSKTGGDTSLERDEHFPELTARMDEISESMQHQIAPQSWTIVIVGWSVSIITFVAFFIAVS